jgi:UDP-N-acetylglucosamine--N-acetylmuramyl-(pentapeptide) pyrophosphoryl-undecaprenol N-acetylglucosamine transferase
VSRSSTDSCRVVIAGGGTGGHVFPALAIKQAIAALRPEAQVVFAGTTHGLEAKVMPRERETLKTFWISGFSRRHIFQNLLLPLKLSVSFAQSLSLLNSFKPHIVIGTGGYVMGPVLWTAQRLGIPTLLQEQNSFPGYTTWKLARHATVVCVGFEDATRWLSAARIEFTGNPLRSSFQAEDPASARQRWNLDPSRKTILVFGGSAGARSINNALAQVVKILVETHNVIWQTGRSGVPDTMGTQILDAATNANHLKVLEFIEDMAGAYAVADLAICRAGAMTLAELAMTGVPAVLVPYPYATDDHQTANAKAVEAHGAAVVIKDSEISPETILTSVEHCIESPEVLSSMSAAMKSLARPDAASRIAELALTIARKS